MANLVRKLNDTRPLLHATLKDRDGTPIDLTGASVRFLWRLQGTTSAQSKAATLVVPSAGEVEVNLTPADLPTAGVYDAEFEITANGHVISVPSDHYLMIRVLPDLG